MNSQCRAPAMLSARKRSAGVLPIVGCASNSPASLRRLLFYRLLRKILLSSKQVAGRLHPAFRKRRLQLRHSGSGKAHVGVSPLIFRVSVAKPLIRNAEAAGEANATVDHQCANVRAVLQLLHLVPVHRPKDRGVHARGA